MRKNNVSEPCYMVLKKQGNIEIRQYPSLVAAEVKIENERYAAINAGFKILAGYIFGDNEVKEKIPMTAPVTQQKVKNLINTGSLEKEGEIWGIHFFLPEGFTLNKLPKPNNKNISLLEISPLKCAVIRFSGLNTKNNLNVHEAILSEYILKNKLNKKSDPIYAFYNPPWILPFFRRNEVMIAVD